MYIYIYRDTNADRVTNTDAETDTNTAASGFIESQFSRLTQSV